MIKIIFRCSDISIKISLGSSYSLHDDLLNACKFMYFFNIHKVQHSLKVQRHCFPNYSRLYNLTTIIRELPIIATWPEEAERNQNHPFFSCCGMECGIRGIILHGYTILLLIILFLPWNSLRFYMAYPEFENCVIMRNINLPFLSKYKKAYL